MGIIKAMRLPWRGKYVPRAVLDINRGCNITCRSCINHTDSAYKSLAEIESELDYLLSRRRLYGVSVMGGEVLLHPKLLEVIKLVKSKGLFIELLTNGVLLDETMLHGLKDAGTDIIFLHIACGQKRPDLYDNATVEDVVQLYREKAALLARFGIDAGVSYTAFKDTCKELSEIVRFSIESPDINYLVVTCFRNHDGIEKIYGDLDRGFTGLRKETRLHGVLDEDLFLSDIVPLLRDDFGLVPFGYIGSNQDATDPRWISFLVGTVTDAKGNISCESLCPSLIERGLLALSVLLKGKYPTCLRQNQTGFKIQLILNALTGGSLIRNLRLFFKSLSIGSTIRAKRLLFQNLAEVLPDGEIVHCLDCPDAVVVKNRLVPVCICDLVDVESHISSSDCRYDRSYKETV